MTDRDLKILRRTILFEGFFRLERIDLRFRGYDGHWSPIIKREVFVRGPTVAVLPYDPVRDLVVLIEQIRIGAVIAGYDAHMLEVVAGIKEHDETDEQCAQRETQEETGLAIRSLERICDCLVSPGGSDETITLFCAHVDAILTQQIHGVSHEHEEIKSEVYPLEEIWSLLDNQQIRNATTLIALLWLRLHHSQLKHKWLAQGM